MKATNIKASLQVWAATLLLGVPVMAQQNHPGHGPGASVTTVTCGTDTVAYPAAKATGSSSQLLIKGDVEGIAQYYDMPDAGTVRGVTFRGRLLDGANIGKTANVTVRVYNASADSLPQGIALSFATVQVDSQLRDYKVAFLAPISLTGPYLVAVEYGNGLTENDTLSMSLNAPGDGAGESLGAGIYNSGTGDIWLDFEHLISSPDRDAMIFPWVSYSLTTGFATPGDTACVDEPLLFTNTSSGFAMNRMYNRRVTNPGTHGDAFAWGFGDGGSSALAEPTHTYAATGPYSVLLTASITGYATQCSEPAAAPLVIADRPVAAFNTSASIVTVGDTVAFTSVSQGDACTWDFGDGSPAVTSCADQVHVYDSAGTFQVTLTVESRHGCSEVATQSVIVDAPTGVAGTAPTVELQAWPNPVSQGATVHLRWDGNGSAARCTLHDLQGKLLATSATVFGGEADLELPNLPGGLYLLSIEQGALRAHRQLMVAR